MASRCHLQIMVSGMERLIIRPKDLAIIFEQLAADKVEKSSSRFAATLNQTDVRIGEINDFRHIQVRMSTLLFYRIERKLPPACAVVKLQMIARDESIGHKALGAKANQLGESIGSRRLEARQNRHRLKQGSFSR